MFWDSPKNQEKFYNLVDRIERLDKKYKIYDVNFQNPWWDIILRQKGYLLSAVTVQFFSTIFSSLIPILVGYSITNSNYIFFIGIIVLWFFVVLIYNQMLRRNAVFQIQTMGSVELSANKFFLTVDPIYHTTKSSGKIISKIGRGSSSYETLLDILSFDLLGIITSMITVAIAMFAFGWQLGLTTFGCLSLIAVFNIIAQIFRTKTFRPRNIKAEDKFKAVSVETLLQAPFIRAIFASIEQLERTKNIGLEGMRVRGNAWQAGTYVNAITRTLYVFSMAIIGSLIFFQVQNGILSQALGISVVLTYINGTNGVLTIGNNIKRLTSALTDIEDLFDFIREFGKQTYPVLNTKNNNFIKS